MRKSGRLLVILFLFFLSVLAVIFFQSSLSKIQYIEVSGNELLSKEDVIRLSGIDLGAQILMLSPGKVSAQLMQHPQIKEAEITRSFPGKVEIHVKENQIVALLLEGGKRFIPILENGHALKDKSDLLAQYPIISNWANQETLPEFCRELAKVNIHILHQISEIRSVPTENDPYKLVVYMRDENEVRTSAFQFSKHMNLYPYIVSTLEMDEKPGVVQLSDAGISYIPFKAIQADTEETPTS